MGGRLFLSIPMNLSAMLRFRKVVRQDGRPVLTPQLLPPTPHRRRLGQILVGYAFRSLFAVRDITV